VREACVSRNVNRQGKSPLSPLRKGGDLRPDGRRAGETTTYVGALTVANGKEGGGHG